MTATNNAHDDQNASPRGNGDQNVVGDIRNATGVAVGAGATVTVGLSVAEVTALVVELKDKDQPQVWDGRIPYLGLNAFQESDAQFFFGREELVDDLLQRVTVRTAPPRRSFAKMAGTTRSCCTNRLNCSKRCPTIGSGALCCSWLQRRRVFPFLPRRSG